MTPNMRQRMGWAALALGLVSMVSMAPSRSDALAIALVPSNTLVMPRQSLFVDVILSGLDAEDVAALRSFDLRVSFGSTRFLAGPVTFDSFLGDLPSQVLAEAIPFSGGIDVAALSLLSTAALDALQPDSFRLARLRLDAGLQLGTSNLSIDPNHAILGGTGGISLAPDSLVGATVAISEIPEPATSLLVAIGAVGLALARRGWPTPRLDHASPTRVIRSS
jgi:hypothetical protein